MRYRTIVELICNASDKDEACNIAGDYLKGNIDFGVELRCRTESLAGHRVIKYAASSAVVLLLMAVFTLRVTSVSVDDPGVSASGYRISAHDTHTVMPELRTNEKEEFKEAWQDRKDEAILDYLKQ